MHTNRLLLGFVLAAGCTSSPDKSLPSATFTPHLESQAASVACGEDVAFYGATSPDLRYAFAYDSAGRISHVDGTWTADNSAAEAVDYTWAGWNLTHLAETWDSSSYTIDASYDASDRLVDYTWAIDDQGYTDSWTYAFSNFNAAGQAQHESITQGSGAAFGYALSYDANDRLVLAVPDSGPSTTWTYDDVARTIAIDSGNGAYHGEIAYDADNRELSETWGGTDPSVIDNASTYTWNGDNLDTSTFSSGTDQAPHTLSLVQTATMRYNCASARKLGGVAGLGKRVPRMHLGR